MFIFTDIKEHKDFCIKHQSEFIKGIIIRKSTGLLNFQDYVEMYNI